MPAPRRVSSRWRRSSTPTSRVRKNGTEVSGRSIMGLMMLAAAPGTVVELSASGPQAEAAVAALADLIECKFNED